MKGGGRPFDCVCVGLSTVDVLALVPRLPREDEKLLTEATLVDGGGPAGTAACAMSRLGLRAAVVSVIGLDLWAPFVLDGFRRFGVDTRSVIRDPGSRTPVSMVLVNRRNASRTILWRPALPLPAVPGAFRSRESADRNGPPGRARIPLGLTTAALLRKGILRTRCLHFDGHLMELSLRLAAQAREKGVLVSYDCGSVKPGWERLAALSDILIASHKLGRQLGLAPAGAVRSLRARFGRKAAVAVTAGEEGVWRHDERTGRAVLLRQARYAALDTTGCGDVFHGAFLAAYLRRPDTLAALRFAQRVAGLKTRGLGGRAAIPLPGAV